MTPDFGDTATRVLLATMTQHRPTVRSVAAAVGSGTSATYAHLLRLRDAGLVTWDDGRHGTLRPTCGFVPVSPGVVRYDDGTAHASGTGAALTRNPAPWAARPPLQRRATVPDSTRTLSVVRGDDAS